MKTALFPGSFDPYTKGHHDILSRALPLFDKIVIAIGYNINKTYTFPIEERIKRIRDTYKDYPNIEVVSYNGLTADLAHQYDAQYIIRGVRNTTDFEYERTIADANKEIGGIETILLYTRPEYSHISSSLVRELYHHGADITTYLP